MSDLNEGRAVELLPAQDWHGNETFIASSTANPIILGCVGLNVVYPKYSCIHYTSTYPTILKTLGDINLFEAEY